jgi:hypothetical protein
MLGVHLMQRGKDKQLDCVAETDIERVLHIFLPNDASANPR